MSNKRARAEPQVVVRGSKMAKDKTIWEGSAIVANAAGTSQTNMGIYPQSVDASSVANRPLTVSGLRWNLSIGIGNVAALSAQGFCKWFIWIRRKAQAIPSVTTGVAYPGPGSAQGDAFATIDESDILVWGNGIIPPGTGPNPLMFEGATKTQRKMQQGDVLVLTVCIRGGTTDAYAFQGLVQSFLKS